MARILLRNITKKFGDVTAVDDLTLEIPDGSFTTLLGPSGCGKTTTLRMIAGLEKPTSGEIWIGDTCVYSAAQGQFVPPGKRQLGLVFQSYALWPHLTVFENIAFGLRVEKRPQEEIQAKVDQISRVLQIESLLQRYPSELSGGQQQRVAIARVLVMEPRVLLLDEPLSNLDAKLRMDMRAELKRLHAETGSTIVYVTHDQLEALTMSTHVALMHHGVLQQWAPPMELYHRPANTFSADFIGNPRINLIPGEVRMNGGDMNGGAGAIDCGDFAIPLASELEARDGQKVMVGLRAEDLTLSRDERPGAWKGTVYSVLPAGSEWYVKAHCGRHELTIRVYDDLDLKLDEAVWIGAVPHRIKCFDRETEVLIPERRAIDNHSGSSADQSAS